MWWRALAFALAIGLLSTLAVPSDRITDTGDRAVYIASMPCANRLQATSSGFVMKDQTVVTVAHALYESRLFAVRDASGAWHDATLSYIDLERDLAVLTVPSLRASPITTHAALAGDRVRMIDGAASGTTEGEVLRPVRITTEVIGDLSQQSQRSGYELSVPIMSGDSGAAVVDDDENLVALIFARSRRRDAAWATSVAEINQVLDLTGGPTWTCDRQSDVQLELVPIEPDRRLAG